jgi:hypothetical protein
MAEAQWTSPGPDGVRRARWVALGDPQSTFDKLTAILRRHDVLDDDGRVRRDVGLLSIGDHFDFGPTGGPEVGAEGLRFLRWLVSHPPDQVVVLAGNHDLSRVQELAFETDESFAAARALASQARALAAQRDATGAAALEERFHAEHPHIPTVEIAARDYSGFTVEQQRFLQALLVSGRLRLAHVARVHGEMVLFTHAGVTKREVSLLGLPETADARTIGEALERLLTERVARVAPIWARGEQAALDLAPVHVMGVTRREGGGLLYQRPSNRAREGADPAWELDQQAPRRFDPRSLPLGVVQACGHSGHRKCRRELAGWVTEAAAAIDRGGIRTLRTDGTTIEYDLDAKPPRPGEATLYLIDGEVDLVPYETYALFPFEPA